MSGNGTTSDGKASGLRGPVVTALAGAAFAVGFVASVEMLALVTPGARASFRTWGPIGTAVAMAAVLTIGLPSAIVVEVAVSKLGHRGLRSTLVGYLIAVAAWMASLLLAWRITIDPSASPLDLGGEMVALLGGALLLWGGARLAERRSSGPAAVFAFAGTAIVGLAVLTAIFLL